MQKKINPKNCGKNYSNLFDRNLQLENNFNFGLKIFEIKAKVKNTDYNLFSYKYKPSKFPFENNYDDDKENYFLCTSYYCGYLNVTKILIENLKFDKRNYLNERISYEKININSIVNVEKENNKEFPKNELILDITLKSRNSLKSNFVNVNIIENFIILNNDKEILIFFLNDIMTLNKNLKGFYISFNEKDAKNLKIKELNKLIKSEIKKIPQTFKWPIITSTKAKIIFNNDKNNNNNKFLIEKEFIFLFYSSKLNLSKIK